MTLETELRQFVASTFSTLWDVTDTSAVPSDDSLPMTNSAKELHGVLLYADMADSTRLVREYKPWFAADIFKVYLYCASRIIRSHAGTITAFDGDRVMAVFTGPQASGTAVRASLQIQGSVVDIVRPALTERWPDETFVLQQKVGIDKSRLFVAQTGMRANRDLVWVGNAANNAAKMAALGTTFSTYISQEVLADLPEDLVIGGDSKQRMWQELWNHGLTHRVHGCNWHMQW